MVDGDGNALALVVERERGRTVDVAAAAEYDETVLTKVPLLGLSGAVLLIAAGAKVTSLSRLPPAQPPPQAASPLCSAGRWNIWRRCGSKPNLKRAVPTGRHPCCQAHRSVLLACYSLACHLLVNRNALVFFSILQSDRCGNASMR